MEEYLYNQALQSIRYGGMSEDEMQEYMALIDKRTEVETLYANNAPIEYVIKSPSADIWRCGAPVITPKRQNLVKDTPQIVDGYLQVPKKPGMGVTIDMDKVMEANRLYNMLPTHDRNDAEAMQYLIPNWKFDSKKPALVR